MSELGIVRVKSEARNSLYMKIGGEGVETRVIDGVLQIRSHSRMMGYLNAESPFDNEGWYDTKDVVEERDGYYKVTGRIGDVINVAGHRLSTGEMEDLIAGHPAVAECAVTGIDDELRGQVPVGFVVLKDGIELSLIHI